ncbi:hypothetical protein BaRGS_00032335 [Batillaria attramentaria]|uniref:PSP proline-rich domain-containing protein n=1 Tax=Batillaria attramentaria TaxID=370345 RepID=A0ABD0JP07_9CAEN
MADDIFGDESLFSEFEKDREQQNIFINYEEDESGGENRSRIVFRNAESEDESSDGEDVQGDAACPEDGEAPSTDTTGAKQDSRVDASAPEQEPKEIQQEFGDDDMTDGFTDRNGLEATTTTSYQERFEQPQWKKDLACRKYLQGKAVYTSSETDPMLEAKIPATPLDLKEMPMNGEEGKKISMVETCGAVARCVTDECSPGVQVVFQNNTFARKYRARIEQFLISLTEHADSKDFSKHSDLSTRAPLPSCVDINDSIPVGKRTNQMWQTHAFHQGFMVDSRGFPLDSIEPDQMVNWEVPKYYQVPKESCFNCGGEHRLSECKLARDHARIRNKRREHQEKQGSSRNKTHSSRYHKDPELDPTKKKFKAGEISTALREAMGLKPEQLPSYIYRMRLFGYPPGWLHEANKKGSSLAMYDKDGNETNLRGESLEDGEVGADNSSDAADAEAFDVEKIIEYPGFTVPVPLGLIDESAALGLPPIQQHQLKKTLQDEIVAKETARKRQQEVEEAITAKRVKASETVEDMELEDDDEAPLPTVTSSPSETKVAAAADDSDSPKSPSMDSLLQQQQQLVQELGSENSDAAASVYEDSNAAPSASAQTPVTGDAVVPGSEDSSSMSNSEFLRQQNFSFTSTSSISKDYGTPIPAREKSFKVLPTDEQFSQGIEDHIPYENLPDATGTFDRMKNLFKIIREKVKTGKKK